MGELPFHELIQRVRVGDQDAAAELLRRYEPAIRRTLRHRIREAPIRRLLDSADICQSVMASFFVRAALGRYDLNQPEELLKLLVAMAHHKLTNAIHKHQAQRRDMRRDAVPVDENAAAAREPTPSQYVAHAELLEEAHRRLSPEEQQLIEWRRQGRTWAEIAAELGSNAEAVRKRHARAVERVAQELGLEEPLED